MAEAQVREIPSVGKTRFFALLKQYRQTQELSPCPTQEPHHLGYLLRTSVDIHLIPGTLNQIMEVSV